MYGGIYYDPSADMLSKIDEQSSSDSDDSIQFDDTPVDIIKTYVPYKDIKKYVPYNRNCRFSEEDPGVLQMDVIPERCVMHLGIGEKIANGTEAIVFAAANNKNHVIRMVQLKTDVTYNGFIRDVHSRYALLCLRPTIPIDSAVDAFICKTINGNRYGVMVLERYDYTLLRHMLNIHSHHERLSFMNDAMEKIQNMILQMHELGFVHRDLHHGNILYRKSDDRIVLTDFGKTISSLFVKEGTTDRWDSLHDSYMDRDKQSISILRQHLEMVHAYISGADIAIDLDDLRDAGISMIDIQEARDDSA
jgi:serine/threonine protein kinase